MRPVIALLTDFGTRDSYVAQMKGVILARCEAELVDLSHEITPFDVTGGAFFLDETAGAFRGERRVIVVAVVDPGVGSSRKLLAANDGNITYLAPDNGLLSVVLSETAIAHEITASRFFLPGGSDTFHGRDRFAPVAAALVNGANLDELGPRMDRGAIVSLGYERPSYDEGVGCGTVTRIDRFGNVITDLDAVRLGGVERIALEIGGVIIARHAPNYAAMEGSPEPFLLAGSRGTVEISIANGDAGAALGIGRLCRVAARPRE